MSVLQEKGVLDSKKRCKVASFACNGKRILEIVLVFRVSLLPIIERSYLLGWSTCESNKTLNCIYKLN